MRGYAEHPPPPSLAPWVSCFWTSRDPAGASHPVHPDGCIDLLFHVERGALEVVGTMTRTLWVHASAPASFRAVRFAPGGAVPWLGERASALTDRAASAEAILGRRGRELEARLCEGDERAFERFLLERSADAVDARVARGCALLSARPAMRIEELTRELGVSRQHARRLFLDHVGVSPKTFASNARAAAALARVDAGLPLARAAAECGYADHAHMTRDLARILGLTPREYRQRLTRPTTASTHSSSSG